MLKKLFCKHKNYFIIPGFHPVLFSIDPSMDHLYEVRECLDCGKVFKKFRYYPVVR